MSEPIFSQTSFAGGMDTQLDPTKSPRNAYPLLVNGRTRLNLVSPTAKHLQIEGPVGNYQGLYVSGSFLLVFISGIAYYGDINEDPIILRLVDSWAAFDVNVPRIYAESAPRTNNLFNREGTPDTVVRVFNNALSVFDAAFYCFDGINVPQAIYASNSATTLGSFATWTQDNPLYVPIGVLPAFAGNKLYVASADFKKIFHSVSGRPSDFVVNLDANGDKGGDADTTSQTVSYNPITAVRALSTGEVFVGTLYSSHKLVPDYSNPIFGEPYLRPIILFPAGPINEISIVDILQDTAFITQSGIHAFNAVAQAMRESNNFPLGAKIRTLITDPTTDKAITQVDTCAILYDDYAFFAVNTIHGYGALVYDTNSGVFQSLDLSFGHVKQFAVTKLSGSERLFFITHDNKLFEAFAGTEKNSTRMLLGEWTPDAPPKQSVSYMVDTIFADVRESGQVKLSFYTDRKLRGSVVQEITTTKKEIHLPISLPFITDEEISRVGYSFGDHFKAWKCAVMVEWNFNAKLSSLSIDGKIETGDNVTGEISVIGEEEKFAFLADSGSTIELNTGGVFSAEGIITVGVTENQRYGYISNGNGVLINGDETIDNAIFTAKSNTVVIAGTGAKTFSLRNFEDYMKVLDSIYTHSITALLHGGDFAYNNGTEAEVRLAKLPIRGLFLPVCGNHDIGTDSGKYFFNLLRTRRFYDMSFKFVDFFWFNGNASEPKGTGINSIQAGLVKSWLKRSIKPFKILIVHQPLWTADISHSTGRSDLRYLAELSGLSAILSGHGHSMERYVVNGFPSFVCGTGGSTLRTLISNPVIAPAFSKSGTFGYLTLTADALTCRIDYRDTDNNVLDSYALYT